MGSLLGEHDDFGQVGGCFFKSHQFKTTVSVFRMDEPVEEPGLRGCKIIDGEQILKRRLNHESGFGQER